MGSQRKRKHLANPHTRTLSHTHTQSWAKRVGSSTFSHDYLLYCQMSSPSNGDREAEGKGDEEGNQGRRREEADCQVELEVV